MTEPREFTTAARRDEPILFKLDGRDYGFRPPKDAIRALPAYVGGENVDYMAARFTWLEKGLNAHDWTQMDDDARRTAMDTLAGPEGAPEGTVVPSTPPEDWQGPQAASIEGRLRADADQFDIAGLEEIMDYLGEVVAGRPTT